MAEIYKTFMAEAKKLNPEGLAKARAKRAELEALRNDAERWRKLRDTPATHTPDGPMRQWLRALRAEARALRAEDKLAQLGRMLDAYREDGHPMPTYSELMRLLEA